MKQFTIILLGLTFIALTAFGQKQVKAPVKAMFNLTQFKKKKKFIAEPSYPGISNPKMRPELTEKINRAAEDFEAVLRTNKATDNNIKIRLKLESIVLRAYMQNWTPKM